MRNVESNITRIGFRPFGIRVVNDGLSFCTVFAPTKMAAFSFRIWCTSCLASVDVIHLLSDKEVAIFPSNVTPDLIVTNGRFVMIYLLKTSFIFLDSSSHTPTSTSIPASCRILIPRPETSGFGSSVATTTFLIPACTIASAQGPVLP
ncbi:hypothetical protein BN2127_JRS1_03008 [Bacillus cereus]|nr:hypothetical protein BN2127_JRS1_03008 [Bacillus cereus]